MPTTTTHDKLLRLRELLLEERQHARNLDLDNLQDAMKEKEDLINFLVHIQAIDTEDQKIASEIRRENRRNAYLYKSALGWIRESMEFSGKKTVTSTYAPDAATIPSQVNGRLLSGKV